MIPKYPQAVQIPTYTCPNTPWESEPNFPIFDQLKVVKDLTLKCQESFKSIVTQWSELEAKRIEESAASDEIINLIKAQNSQKSLSLVR